MNSNELDHKIAALEIELAGLRSQRKHLAPATPWKKPEGKNPGDPFLVSAAEDLTLSALPDLARSILDAIPVQVFLKHSEIHGDLGRKYTFLNRTAREILKWTEDDVARNYDSQAFPTEGPGPELYRRMQDQETTTLEARHSRLTKLDWTPGTGGWHHNSTMEIPILGSDGHTLVGFCAIAEDIIFRDLPKEWAYFQMVFHHHYKNLSSSLLFPIEDARKTIRDIRQAPSSALALLERINVDVEWIKKRLRVADRSSRMLYDALVTLAPPPANHGRVDQIADEIAGVYLDGHFSFCYHVEPDAATKSIYQPHVVKGLLTLLIGNAEKHSSTVDGAGECRMSCRLQGNEILWDIANPCTELKGELKYSNSGNPNLDDALTKGFDGLMIGSIISRAFPQRSPHEVIVFPKHPIDGWVTVSLRCEVVADA